MPSRQGKQSLEFCHLTWNVSLLGCYHLLSPGRKLTNSAANFQLDLMASCQDKCDSSEDFECIAYSFG